MGFFSFRILRDNYRFIQAFDLVLTEEAVITQVANSLSGYHPCDPPTLGKQGPGSGQTRQWRGTRQDSQDTWVLASGGDSLAQWLCMCLLIALTSVSPLGRGWILLMLFCTQGCHDTTRARKGSAQQTERFHQYEVV